MEMPGRKYEPASGYRYGFNGKEQDNEVSGQGNQYDYGFRIYNPRLGRFLSVDPLTDEYPWYTPYQFAGNMPINSIDVDGLEDMPVFDYRNRKATIGINLIVVIDANTGYDVTKAKSQIIHTVFAKGNETIYLDNLPESKGGESVFSNEISKRDFEAGKGYEVTIQYNVTSQVMNHKEFMKLYKTEQFSPLFTFLSYDVKTTDFSGDEAVFNSSTTTPQIIKPNSDFFKNYTGDSNNPTIEEWISHEAGYHNMMGKRHSADAKGNVIYPSVTTPTLESKTRGMIFPIHLNTMQILKSAVEKGGARRDNTNEVFQNVREQSRRIATEALKNMGTTTIKSAIKPR